MLAMLLLSGLTACGHDASTPELIETYRFSQPGRNEALEIRLRKAPGATLMIRVEGYETAFESILLDSDGNTVSAARLPYLRAGPVLQVVEFQQDTDPVSVSIRPDHLTKNSVITVRVFSLPGDTELDAARIRAIRLYMQAIQSTDDESIEVWTDRVEMMRLAAAGFAHSGDMEEQLWSKYLAAYFTYFPLYEFQSAIEMAREVQVQARDAGFPLIDLMAKQLEGQALIERDDSDSPELAAQKFIQAQQVLQASAELALERGMHFEQMWAINNRGIGYFYQELFHEALEQYRHALQMALDLQDAYLINLVGGNIALVHERLGDHKGALEALLAIKQELDQSGVSGERAHNLAEIGRVYGNLFRFPEAITALTEAMNISRELGTKEGTGRIGLSLARAYHDMGHRERAQDILLPAIVDMKQSHFGLGLREAYRMLADIHRFRGEHDLVEASRGQQGQYLTSGIDRADFLFDQGLDARANGAATRARALFAESHEAAVESDYAGLQIRSLLQRCALTPVSAPGNAACEAKRLESMLTEWLPRGTPRDALDARFTWAQFLAVREDDAAALIVLEDLVADIWVYRARLRGVLGAWYWESRHEVFTFYMDLLLSHAQSQEQVMGALLALDRFRNLEVSGRRSRGFQDESNPDFNGDEIRGLIASMAQAQDDNARLAFSQAIDRHLLAAGAAPEYGLTDDEDRLRGLESLPADAAFLTYYFSESGAWAWLAGQQGLRLIRLGDSKPVLEIIGKVRAGLRMVGYSELDRDLDELGGVLLEPLGTALPDIIYLGSAGVLAGLPFEAIRRNGRYLAQDHTVINLLSLNGLHDTGHSERVAREWDSVFLAGAPMAPGGNLVDLSGAASEIASIARLFEGQRVHKVTGEDLRRVSFAGPAFSEAGLIHIASHGTINLEYPELSRLILSGQPDDGAQEFLTPLDIRQVPVEAGLVVLSACETTGLNDFSFDSNLGFVSQFLQSGAGAVVASLWPVSDRQTRDFMVDFYSALFEGADISNALVLTKRKHMNAARANGLQDWASFQIYVD